MIAHWDGFWCKCIRILYTVINVCQCKHLCKHYQILSKTVTQWLLYQHTEVGWHSDLESVCTSRKMNIQLICFEIRSVYYLFICLVQITIQYQNVSLISENPVFQILLAFNLIFQIIMISYNQYILWQLDYEPEQFYKSLVNGALNSHCLILSDHWHWYDTCLS